MERKKVGNNLVIIGFILFIVSSGLFTFITGYWPTVSSMMSYEDIVVERKITILVCVIALMLNICSLGFTIIGGRYAEKSRGYWLLFAGLILLIINLLIGVTGYLFTLSGIELDFFSTIQILLFYYILSGSGIIVILVGVLMKLKNRKR
jgi:hypothetical protein